MNPSLECAGACEAGQPQVRRTLGFDSYGTRVETEGRRAKREVGEADCPRSGPPRRTRPLSRYPVFETGVATNRHLTFQNSRHAERTRWKSDDENVDVIQESLSDCY